jgi:hypothetical protein
VEITTGKKPANFNIIVSIACMLYLDALTTELTRVERVKLLKGLSMFDTPCIKSFGLKYIHYVRK